MEQKKLFSDFAPVSKQEWLDKIQVDLKGADFNKKMVWRTNEGFSVQPFYQQEDVKDLPLMNSLPGEFPYVRGNKADDNTWFVRQNICVSDAKEANAKALDILNKGIDSLGFCVPADKLSAEFIETLLSGIYADCVELNFKTCQRHSVELAKLLALS